jgi:chorismate dehydratase
MIRISAVSYLNTLPFIHGIENSGFLEKEEYQLIRDIPSECASKLENQTADIVLVPVAAIANIKNVNIVTDFCIGATKNVISVLLVSDVPVEEIESIYLDYQSRTSVNLVQVLAKKHWKKEFKWLHTSPGYEKNISLKTGGVIIGDRALEIKGKYEYCYDLATEWNHLTGLPFVFACWATRSKIDTEFLNRFNKSLEWGINNINQIHPGYKNMSDSFILEYFKNNIEYHFDASKLKGMQLFFKYLNELP